MLQSLDVGYNLFSGSFNALLDNCGYIVSFQADGNMLSGPLPANMASLGLMVCLQTARFFVPLLTLLMPRGCMEECHVFHLNCPILSCVSMFPNRAAVRADSPPMANAYQHQTRVCVLNQHIRNDVFCPFRLMY